MPRKKTIRIKEIPYHVVNRTNHQDWFSIPLVDVWKIARQSFLIANEKHPVNLHLLLLMNNHYHMILDTPDSNIDSFMYEFNKNFSLQLRIKTSKINKMFGGRYKWSLISSREHYYNVIKYVLRNPVKAGIVKFCEEWKFSTMFYDLNFQKNMGLLTKNYLIPIDKSFINWINEGHTNLQNESIKKGLRKGNFTYSGSRGVKPPTFFSMP